MSVYTCILFVLVCFFVFFTNGWVVQGYQFEPFYDANAWYIYDSTSGDSKAEQDNSSFRATSSDMQYQLVNKLSKGVLSR